MFLKVKDNNFSSAEHGNLIGCSAILRFSEMFFWWNLAEPETRVLVKRSPVFKLSSSPQELVGSHNCTAALVLPVCSSLYKRLQKEKPNLNGWIETTKACWTLLNTSFHFSVTQKCWGYHLKAMVSVPEKWRKKYILYLYYYYFILYIIFIYTTSIY